MTAQQHPAAENTIAHAVLEAGRQLGLDHVLLSVRYGIASAAVAALLGEPAPEPETFYAIRRTDGEEIGDDYAWLKVAGPDDWSWVDDYEDHDEPTEFEIVLMTVTPVAKRTFGTPEPDEDDE